MEQSEKTGKPKPRYVVAGFMIGIAFLLGHSLGYNEALTDEKMRADQARVKEPKRISGERMIRAGYPGLPAHLRCPAKNGRGQLLKQWHAMQADGGNWEVACTYEDSQ